MPSGQYDRSSQRPPPSIPPIIDICQKIPDEVAAIEFLTSHGILTAPKETICSRCGYRGCRIKSKRTPKSLKCNLANCGKSQSLLQGTIFAKSRMPLHQLLYLSVFWLFVSPANIVTNQLHCSGKMVADFYKLFRQMVTKIVVLDNDLTWGIRLEMNGNMAVAMWRERNAHNLWGAFLAALKTLKYDQGKFQVKESNDLFESNLVADIGSPGEEQQNNEESPRQTEQPHRAINNVDYAVVGAACIELQKQEIQQHHKKKRNKREHEIENNAVAGVGFPGEELQNNGESSQQIEQSHHAINNVDAAVAVAGIEFQQQEVQQRQQQKRKRKKGEHKVEPNVVGGIGFAGEELQNDGESSQQTEQPLRAINNSMGPAVAAAGMALQQQEVQQQQQKKKQQKGQGKNAEQPMQLLGQKRKQTSLFSFAELKATKDQIPHPQSVEESPASTRPHKLQSIPSFMDICCMIPSEDKAIAFLIGKGIFNHPKDITCAHCGYKGFRAKSKKTLKSIKCNRCSKGRSLMKGTFFEGTKAPLHQVLYIALFWLSLSPASTVITQLRCSSATVTDFSDKLRRLTKRFLEGQHQQQQQQQQQGEGNNNIMPVETKARLKRHTPKFARKLHHDDHVYAAMWREMNVDNLWEALLVALRMEKNDDGLGEKTGNEPWVDEMNGKACCKYHLKLHLKLYVKEQKQQSPQQQ